MTESYKFPLEGGDTSRQAFSRQPSTSLSAVADLLRASIFYFHIDYATLAQARGDVRINGSIRCRLALPDQQDAFEKLLAMTEFFSITDKSGYRMFQPSVVGKQVKADVEITGELGAGVEQVRIEAVFQMGRRVAISGFPITAAVRSNLFFFFFGSTIAGQESILMCILSRTYIDNFTSWNARRQIRTWVDPFNLRHDCRLGPTGF